MEVESAPRILRSKLREGLRTIYSRFKDSGIIELLVEAGVGTQGTIRAPMTDSDIKQGIRYLKILYETLLRNKHEFLEKKANQCRF